MSTTSTREVNIPYRLTGLWRAVERSGPLWTSAGTIVIKRQMAGLPVKLREQVPELSGHQCGSMSARVTNQPGLEIICPSGSDRPHQQALDQGIDQLLLQSVRRFSRGHHVRMNLGHADGSIVQATQPSFG